MIKVRIQDSIFEIPDSILEITEKHFRELAKNSDPIGRFKALSGSDSPLFEKLEEDQIETLGELTEFVLPGLLQIEPELEKSFEEIDVSERTFEKMELAREAIEKASLPFFSIPEILDIYKPGFISPGDPLSKFLSQGLHILEACLLFLSNFRTLGADFEKPDQDEEAAGVEDLEVFGTFGTVYLLAGGDVLKFDRILEAPASVVYMALAYKSRLDRYKENLYDIKNKRVNVSTNS